MNPCNCDVLHGGELQLLVLATGNVHQSYMTQKNISKNMHGHFKGANALITANGLNLI
jgi:hypothetical protein